MKVKELKAYLDTLDPDMEVVTMRTDYDDYEPYDYQYSLNINNLTIKNHVYTDDNIVWGEKALLIKAHL